MKIETLLASLGGVFIVLCLAFIRYAPSILIAFVVYHFIVKWW